MSPFVLLQLVGPAVALHVAETMHEAFPDRFTVSENLRRSSPPASRRLRLGPGQRRSSTRRWPRCSRQAPPSLTGEEVRRTRAGRARRGDADHARRGRGRGRPRTSTCAMLLGAGWPFHLGGVTPYLDRTGISERVTGRASCRRGGLSRRLARIDQPAALQPARHADDRRRTGPWACCVFSLRGSRLIPAAGAACAAQPVRRMLSRTRPPPDRRPDPRPLRARRECGVRARAATTALR